MLGTSTKAGPKLLAGSHLESQNYAGWLDGPLGVVYALEAARVINPDPAVNGAVEVAAWCDEEGHFGSFPRQPVLCRRRDARPTSTPRATAAAAEPCGTRCARCGLAGRPRARAERGRHIGYLEAHIEQGQTLESGGLKIGVVTSIVGIWQYRITFEGEQNHAGTTRMAFARMPAWRWRGSALRSTSRFPDSCGPRTVWTTGRITLDPGAPSIIPGARGNAVPDPRRSIPRVIDRLEDLLQRHGRGGHRAGPLQLSRSSASAPARPP